MTDLVTLDDAKEQLRLDGTDEDTYVASLVTAASATVVDYVKSTDAQAWTAETVPALARVAVLLVLASLYADREGGTDPIGVAVQSLLMRVRDPALQ
ncbi:head-tail connector protein [Robbsia andropogonis]|uniref:head-tail connector protein n=1 Tax=Robbsia andropogonis TaxID=28092 RepID=UPI002A6A942C|nr:head-tail connector protein [Robbsia andropogonis]